MKETPDVPWDDPKTWANVDDFGADPQGQIDSSAAIQKAMDSGASTVLLPGSYNLRSAVTIRGKVRRVVGLGGMINYGKGLHPDMRLADGDAPVVVMEHFSNIHGGLEIATHRTLVMRSVSDCDLTSTAAAEGGELFFEDFVTHDLKLRKQRVWARQLNIENQGTHLVNDASDLWILASAHSRRFRADSFLLLTAVCDVCARADCCGIDGTHGSDVAGVCRSHIDATRRADGHAAKLTGESGDGHGQTRSERRTVRACRGFQWRRGGATKCDDESDTLHRGDPDSSGAAVFHRAMIPSISATSTTRWRRRGCLISRARFPFRPFFFVPSATA